MSNLKLPRLTYDSLSQLLGGRPYRNIGYKTDIERDYRYKYVLNLLHHGTHIATITDGEVELFDPGWHSVTTANRMNRVCVDNGLEARVGFRRGRVCLLLENPKSPTKRVEYHLNRTPVTLVIGTD